MSNGKFPYTRLIESNYVYKVLRQIQMKEEGNYATQIAEEIGKGGREEATRVCSRLQEEEFIKKGKRSRAQYYKINEEGLWKNFQKIVDLNSHDELKEITEGLSELPETEKKEEKEKELLLNYVNTYFTRKDESTLTQMLIRDYISGLSNFISLEKEYIEIPDWFILHYSDLSMKIDYQVYSHRFVKEAFKNLD